MPFLNPASDDFLFDDRFREDDDWDNAGWGDDGDLLEDGDAYALEDLLRLAQQAREDRAEDGTDGDAVLTADSFSCDEDALIWGLSILCGSPLGRAMAFDARFEEWSLEVDDIDDGVPVLDSQLRILILPRGVPTALTLSRSLQDRLTFLTVLAQGLRLIWQDMNGMRSRTDLTADDMIFFERMRTADRDVAALRILWDLRDEGISSLWRTMIAGSLGDVAMIAGDIWESTDYPAGLPQAFLAWLASDRLIADCDSRTLDDMDARLQKSSADVCGLAMITPEDLLILSRLPDGESYLTPLARTLCYTAEFRRIPDPINEAHLKQILEDCGEMTSPSLIFRDSDLERKIFPDRMIDTVV